MFNYHRTFRLHVEVRDPDWLASNARRVQFELVPIALKPAKWFAGDEVFGSLVRSSISKVINNYVNDILRCLEKAWRRCVRIMYILMPGVWVACGRCGHQWMWKFVDLIMRDCTYKYHLCESSRWPLRNIAMQKHANRYHRLKKPMWPFAEVWRSAGACCFRIFRCCLYCRVLTKQGKPL